jgi:hypothetical protein
MSPIVVEGRFLSPTQIELAQPVTVPADVAVEVEIRPRAAERREALIALLNHMASRPPGHRSKEDIDRQIEEERRSWESQR